MRLNRGFFILAIFSLVFFRSFGQDENKETARQIVEIANEAYFNLRVILIANEQYAQAAELDPENIEANYMAGRTFLETNSKANATKYLLRVYDIDPEYRFNILYLIGQGFQYGLEFSQAINYYNLYRQKVIESTKRGGEDYTELEEVERRIYECQNGLEYVNTPRDYVIENLGPSVNSEWDDYAPSVTADESLMVFTTRRQDGNTNENVFDDMLYYEDVFYTERVDGKWEYAKNIGPPVNITYHSSNLAISADGTELYLYKSQNGGDIFLSKKNPDGSWSEPEPLNDKINSSYSENSVSLSPDGSMLFFSSDRPIDPDKEDLDIYMSRKDRRGEWGPPKNLGEVINTDQDEDGPFFDYDGKTLYFSSKGHKGMGGYDIYKSEYDEAADTWSEPVNLGYPMNSPDNDIYFVSARDGKRGYYASAKADGLGFTDIYQIRLADLDAPPQELAAKTVEPQAPIMLEEPEIIDPEPEPELIPSVLVLKTMDKETGQLLDAEISIAFDKSNRKIALRRNNEGTYQARLANETRDRLRITIQKPGYMYKNVNMDISAISSDGKTFAKDIMLDKIQTGYHQVIRNIYFDFGTARLKPSSNPELQKLLRVLNENPRYLIEISGHTDNVGGKDFNQWLSQRRAQAVVNFMVKKGQSDGRFLVEGYGESQPMASNDDEEMGRELNRRVEFRVLQFKQ